ncbi:S8 family peptidase [Oceanithermus sp.]
MKRLHLILFAIVGALLFAGCSNTFNTTKQDRTVAKIQAVEITADHVSDQLVVAYDDQAALDELLATLGDGAEVLDTIEQAHAALIQLPDGLDASHALGKLASQKVEGIRLAQPNFIHPHPQPVESGAIVETLGLNDPLEAQKWDHEIMQAADAWETDVDGAGTTPDGSGVVIGVVDTGIDGTHPDLYGAFVNGYDATGCLRLPNDVIPPNYDATYPGEIHGTHVAGIAAARGNNGQGVAGIAYNAQIMDLKVFCGSYTDDWTIATAIFAAISDVDGDGITPNIITMSLGGKGYGWVVKYAIDTALMQNVVITVAMGNSFQDEVEYPAGYPGIIAVGATNAQDEKADFSTSGSHISVSAPGVDILSTWPTWDYDANGIPYLYYRISGTSMATPEVAGAAALVKQFLPAATAYEVKRLLETTADDIGEPGFDNGTGYGRVNLKKLVDKVHDVLAGTASLEQGGTALVNVTTLNKYDSDGDGAITAADDTLPLPAVDVYLLKDGRPVYLAKTDYSGVATFTSITPGDYQVMIAGQDGTDWDSSSYWPYERVSWDADGDPANGVTPGILTVNAGPNNNLAAPDVLDAALNTPAMKITLEWTGGGDLDLAVNEFDPSVPGSVWATPKTGALWGTFSGDDTGADPTHATETYTLNDTHYPTPAGDYYTFGIDATNATVGTTATIKLEMGGRTFSYGPISVTPGTTADISSSEIFWNLFLSYNFDNMPCVY